MEEFHCQTCRQKFRKYVAKYKCPHDKRKYDCQICDEIGHLAMSVRGIVRHALKSDKTDRSVEYLGCTIEFYKGYLESLFKPDMNWQNHGTLWEIDHIIPIKFENPDLETVKKRLHYTNTQPLYASENRSKGNRFVG